MVNIGGISNVTYLSAGGVMADVRAFDTGPGNMVLDAIMQETTKGNRTYDAGGDWRERARYTNRCSPN